MLCIYRSEFGEFCKEHSIIHENSSPYYPQSNGLSKSAVKQMNFFLKKGNENLSEFCFSLLEFRNTPNISGKSPSQTFFCHRLRGYLSHLPEANDLDIANAKAGTDHRKYLMKNLELQPAAPLRKLLLNQCALFQDPHTKSWDIKGHITSIRPKGRSYNILLDSGKTVTRNRANLRPIYYGTHDDDNFWQTSSDDSPKVNIKQKRFARLSKK